MELTNDFRVSVPPAMAWKVFTDVERIAPLLPGAQLQEIEGDEFRGIVKVKVGPIQAQYKGVATFLEQDESAGKVVLKATGRDTRGQGNANATITAVMTADGEGTKVSVVTDLTVTGKVAQFGRGVLADVSGKLIGQFVDALEADLERGDTPAAEPSSNGTSSAGAPAEAGAAAAGEPLVSADPEAATPAAATTDTTGLEGVLEGGPVGAGTTAEAVSGSAAPASGTSTGPRKINSPEPEPVDLLDAAGGSVAKRAVPVGAGVLVLVVVLLLRRRAKAKRSAASRLKSLPSHVEVPSWSDVRGQLPDPEELKKMGRKAAKRATKAALAQTASARRVAAEQAHHAAALASRAPGRP